MTRKLASVVRVDEILPIPNADAIEVARIKGWKCVVKKGEFKAGDLGVYFEIDSIPPDDDRFQWLWKPKGHLSAFPRPEKFRIRTMTLRKQLSQGLLMPLAAFDGGPVELGAAAVLRPKFGSFDTIYVKEGDDLTEALGVTKYEPPLPHAGEIAGFFPGIWSKTEETRIQNMPEVLDELQGLAYVMTLKCDGTSATFGFDTGGIFHACSRNFSMKEGANCYWAMVEKYDLRRICHQAQVVIQGEIVGPGIQGNPMGLKAQELRVFNVISNTFGRLPYHAMARFCEDYGLTPVPVVEEGDAFNETVESLLRKAEGKYVGTNNEREGLVVRPRDIPIYSNTLGGPLSFKVISNRYLLSEKD